MTALQIILAIVLVPIGLYLTIGVIVGTYRSIREDIKRLKELQ